MRKIVALLLACIGLSSCVPTPADREALHYVAAVEIPIDDREDKSALAKLLSSLASSHQGLHVDENIGRTAEHPECTGAPDLDDRLIPIITIWRGDDDDQLVGSVSDLTNRRRVWATFNKGREPEMEAQFREAALELIMKRWPDANALPVLPRGGLPLPRDLVMTSQGYRIDRSRAEAYSLSPDSDLLTN
ncbi:hypothetical protein [Porphyrobacter sp. ULC335]|uniref:hypothetical protein n=1 Tax=Porphyrobacter sp. ULC335 TaxID=2854260 RepID=UPI00221ECFAF|nr:hypothetical protein [Porphyrobacter sp. ULC335]UYV15416.1 hypothetical protein KVF90_15095 [Porphyrobacter sp. ULC335]